jgi:hypothetical protein
MSSMSRWSYPLFAVVAACGGASDDGPPEPVEYTPSVACGAALPGPALSSVESESGYAAAVAALDLATVPDPYDFSGEIGLTRGLINYMLRRPSGTTFTRAEAEAAGESGRAILAAIAITPNHTVDLVFLRRGLYYAYNCTTPLPATIDQLVERYGDFTTWPTIDQDCAPPKDSPRRIMTNYDQGVFVAETWIDGTTLRETEVVFTNLRGDGNLDFGVYTADGLLSDRSTFATTGGSEIVGAAPYTCMTCHVDRDTWTFSILQPTGTGAGCN